MINGYDWVKELPCRVTVCDLDGNILYMNDASAKAMEKYGDMMGKNIAPCHNERSNGIIKRLIDEGTSNHYTLEKQGKKTVVHQMAWFRDGEVAGIMEFAFDTPYELPHYVR